MKRLIFLLIVIGLGLNSVAIAMSKGQVRKETRFLTDKMAYELSLSTRQYSDVYEINYDFIYAVRPIMDEIVRGYEWAVDAYYDALDIRNDDLRWVLSERQYRRFVSTDYFYRPIHVRKGSWSLRVYIHYPNREQFFLGVPHHCYSYCGSHYRSRIYHVSHYKERYASIHHCSVPHRVREHRLYHSYRRSDFGNVHFRPRSSERSHGVSVRSSAPVHENTSKQLNRRNSRIDANTQKVSHRRSKESNAQRNSVSERRFDKRSSSGSERRSHRGDIRFSEQSRSQK